jgi:hypothetical protein
MFRDHPIKFLLAMMILVLCTPAVRAETLAAAGNLDCNGFSAVQEPLKAYLPCSDFFSSDSYQRGHDNGHYIGHDEPSVGFFSNAPHSGNSVQWYLTLPRDRPLPAVQTFELTPAIWFAMAICDPNSFPNGPCIPDSDQNTPSQAGSAFLALQFYPPGFPPFITQLSCDLTHWCAALNIDSLEVNAGGVNPNCTEPVNFAFIQTNGVPAGPPGPASATSATFTPNANTLLMNSGDLLRITIMDTAHGLITRVDDLTTGKTGFMVASGANGFQNTDPNSCAGTSFDFHPEFDTARFGNFVPWAALQANINLAVEIGHFQPGRNGDHDSDDPPCFPGPTVPGCLGANIEFDGPSYLFAWPDGTRRNATSLVITNPAGGLGPLSQSSGGFNQSYPIMQWETNVSASESSPPLAVGCQPNGVGCVVPPTGAQFYPYYSVGNSDGQGGWEPGCTLLFGNISGPGINTYGRDRQFGTPDLAWFFGQNSSGPFANPCVNGYMQSQQEN